MKVVAILKWEGNKQALAVCYADTASDLTTELVGLTLTKGSLAYLANGNVYVLGESWQKIGG